MSSSPFDLGDIKIIAFRKPIGNCINSNCVECLNQFRSLSMQEYSNITYHGPAATLHQANQILSGYANNIASDLGYLTTKLAAHGDTVINKWKKKSHQKRLDEMRATNIFKFEGTQYLVWARHELIDWKKGRNYRNNYLLPYIELESLKSDPYRFLALLYARTKYTPVDWVSFDLNQTCTGWHEGRLAIQYGNCTVSLRNKDYGRIIPWISAEAHGWDSCAFPRAKVILEAQSVLMGFLRKIVHSLVEDLQQESGCLRWIQLADTGFRGAAGTEKWSTFTNKAFSNPKFNFGRLLEIARSNQAEATDHLWLLQTDASYMLDHIKMCLQGCIWNQKDEKSSSSNRYGIFPSHLWMDPYGEATKWNWVVEELEHTKSVYEEFQDSIHVGQAMPPQFDLAMGSLEVLLVNLAQQKRATFRCLIPQLTGFQNWFTFDTWIKGKLYIKLQSRAVNKFQVCYYEDPLFWCLWALGNDFEQDDLMNPAILFKFLDEQLAKETTEGQARVERRLMRDLASLVANHELLSAVRHFRPMCSNTTAEQARANGTDRACWRAFRFKPNLTFPTHLSKNLGKAFKTLEGLKFPSGIRNAAWLQRVDEIRKASSEFWAKSRELENWNLDQEWDPRPKSDKEPSLALLGFDQAPEHLAALKAEREAILAPKPRDKQRTEYTTPDWDASSVHERKSHEILPNTKSKTRPENLVPINDIEQDFSSITLTSTPSTTQFLHDPIIVKSESFRTLTRLYPITVDEYAAKPLDWRTFVVAMEDVGFLATRSGGSAVAFVRESEGRIVLHRPHPVAKIEQIWLQSWGKRMKKWFGWDREVFVCVKDEKKKVEGEETVGSEVRS